MPETLSDVNWFGRAPGRFRIRVLQQVARPLAKFAFMVRGVPRQSDPWAAEMGTSAYSASSSFTKGMKTFMLVPRPG
jgi:hypothetical protein